MSGSPALYLVTGELDATAARQLAALLRLAATLGPARLLRLAAELERRADAD